MPAMVNAVRQSEESAFSFALRVLTASINDLRFLPGDRLMEADIAAQLCVSRTPVHDAFVYLARQNLLMPARRGYVVQPLRVKEIRQQVWMYRTVGLAVLGGIFNLQNLSDALQPIQRCVHAEYQAAERRDTGASLQASMAFFEELYALSGHQPAYRAMTSVGTDYLRLLRLGDDPNFWQGMAEQHKRIVLALEARQHEAACAALERQFQMIDPLISSLQRRWPGYFV